MGERKEHPNYPNSLSAAVLRRNALNATLISTTGRIPGPMCLRVDHTLPFTLTLPCLELVKGDSIPLSAAHRHLRRRAMEYVPNKLSLSLSLALSLSS